MDARTSTDQTAEFNRQWWDTVRRQRDEGLIQKQHDVAADILAGKTALSLHQRQFLGDVAGKRMLDLGCGDGFELLEWARAGADVVGVDNSPVQLAAAQRAADTLGVPCKLVLADLLRLPEELLQAEFDICFSAYVTAWIGDLDQWFGSVYRALRPGGVFLLSGGHPLSGFFSALQRGEPERQSYFQEGPFVTTGAEPSAAWNPRGEPYTTVEWRWMVGSIVTAVARAGLRISHLVECGEELAQTKMGLPAGYPGEIIIRAVKT